MKKPIHPHNRPGFELPSKMISITRHLPIPYTGSSLKQVQEMCQRELSIIAKDKSLPQNNVHISEPLIKANYLCQNARRHLANLEAERDGIPRPYPDKT